MRRMLSLALTLAIPTLLILSSEPTSAQKKDAKEVVPHGQSAPPGPALEPADAIKKMKVPEGFTVELVASEPQIVNPVAMTFDEKGRIWITESLEYPRRSPGPGKDRIKILEDTTGTGKYDRVTVFMEGLNIPSGIAVGHGGVWYANAPDLLFVKEKDGKPVGQPEVVVTGFGRSDTHELPNSLTWGPDGWLYGLNGVFNPSVIKHQGKEHRFTCALFRIHPKTREFEVFCEGTSNPWGVAIDSEGSFFVSACVIDHLWHLVETGYYHRQGGPYPPYTWKIESIVKHRHQKAAYCGIHFHDSDVYPPQWRDRLFMGNIHGNCINCDELTRKGASYFGKPHPEALKMGDAFLSANDAWFMPVVQKTGPDGCLYILDWYDRYHCYQDANRDPGGIDRLRGRLYRVRYKDSPRAPKFDLNQETDDQLIQRLHSPNVLFRDLAQRALNERNSPDARPKLQKLVLDNQAPHKARMHALWALIGTGTLEHDFHLALLGHSDPGLRAWGVRAAGNMKKVAPDIATKVAALATDASPDVQLQVAIAARKINGLDPVPLLARVLATSADESELIPHIVWQNLYPLLENKGDQYLAIYEQADAKQAANLAILLPRVTDRVLAAKKADPAVVAALVGVLVEGKNANSAAAQKCITLLGDRIQSGEVADEQLEILKAKLTPIVRKLIGKPDHALHLDAGLLAATMKDPAGFEIARVALASKKHKEAIRLEALESLIAGQDASLLDAVEKILIDKENTTAFRGQIVNTLGGHNQPQVAVLVLKHYPQMEAELQPKAIEVLTQRTPWSKELLAAIGQKKIPPSAINVNQVRRLLASKDDALIKQVKDVWGVLREDRNPAREKIVGEMRDMLKKTPGNAVAGIEVYKKLCAQCHKLHGEGQEVGPDITNNGRNDFEQLLSNVFDPSLVIGTSYQAVTVTTKKGQIITGLVVEDNAQRVILKVQGGKIETIPRAEVDEQFQSKLSMMPEDLEKQLKPQEIADLFAYICLDKPPSDPTAKRIPGAPNPGK